MKCFKRIPALIIAGVTGITYICSSMPVYALERGSVSYYAPAFDVNDATQEGVEISPELPVETSTPEAMQETFDPMGTATPGVTVETEEPVETPNKTDLPGVASPDDKPEGSLPTEGVATKIPSTVEPGKTDMPQFTSPPMQTNPPVKTKTPNNTESPPDRTEKPGSIEQQTAKPSATQSPGMNINGEYCKITYQLNGGTNHRKNPDKVKKKGVRVVLNAPAKAKYTFVGWYTDAKYTKKVTTVGNTSLSCLTLYAKWKKVTVKQVILSYAKKKGVASILVRVKKEKGVAGFEYVYARDSYFKRKYKLHTKKNPKTLSKLTRKNTYYIRVRAYKLDSTGKKIYGIYSRVKRVKI